ncbi:MAG: glycosyl transferase, partial [Hyphomonadaceae bacterium]|nr:glycosyl transferase [Clostridia bacterium]
TALTHEFYADGPVWIAPAVYSYIAETGDDAILDLDVPYFDEGSSSVWEHMLTAVRFLYNDRGEHGLCHIHDGDWCDTAHLLGKKGIGEGVWLSIALYNTLQTVIEIAHGTGRLAVLPELMAMAEDIKEKVNEHGWDGDWYLIAYNDEGRKIGSHESEEGKLFLNPQSWAVLSGIAPYERVQKCFEAIDKKLDTWIGPLLLTPAFTKKDITIGSITGFHPGTIENGACYCHAASFKIVADCKAGRGEQAYETLMKIVPGGTADDMNEQADCPPYAFTNCRYSPEHPYLAGRFLNTWITGTVSWCWQAMTEWILGVRKTLDGLLIDPCIPAKWEGFTVSREYRGTIYHIEVKNPKHLNKGVQSIIINGKEIAGNIIPICKEKEVQVLVVMG